MTSLQPPHTPLEGKRQNFANFEVTTSIDEDDAICYGE
jgi:hypothetical protein